MTDAVQVESFDRLPQGKTYEAVVEQIKERIVSGRLKPGSPLPTERVFCDELGVSRSSVREALRTLEAIGIVEVRRGRGADRRSRINPRPSDVLAELFSLNFSLYDWDLEHIVVARAAIEKQAALQGGTRPWEEADAEQIRECLVQMERPVSPREYYPLDMEFHLLLAYHSQNPVLVTILEGLRGSVAHLMIEGFERVEDWSSVQERLTSEHEKIWQQFQDGNAREAAAHLEDHIVNFYSAALQFPEKN